ncbi:MAG TPA: thiamine phosphate synthase [Xanthobacteraceae bacterium]|nr:thiamine phosphate synthase [Xanthobacteraceae bacterium]
MTKHDPQPKRPAPRLYLVTPEVAEAEKFSRLLEAALAAADVAAVLLRLQAADPRTLINRVKMLAPVVQRKDVALVLDGHPDIVARAGADGAQLAGIAAFSAAVDELKPSRIAGCAGLNTRHDAMLAGEQGADYVLFGEREKQGRRPSFAAIVERLAWWAELFEVPCVGYAERREEIAPLAEAGADFVAVDFVWTDARGVGRAVVDAAERLSLREHVA